MNKEQTIEAIKVMQAFVDGKEVIARHVNFGTWDTLISPKWSWEDCEYRIKPTPVLRPWTADEVPLGAWIKLKHDDDWKSLILEVDRIGKICVYGGTIFCEAALENHEHSTDSGKTWKECGVMEEGK
jgi:hypothetical protein